ncbi:hypothetical protein HDU76_010916 [Blyttiomyces sp. JEL0837]|nr:hypothetical protein HDU76_010916 [Blyttiomyces sp. JEL0837]
MLPRDKTWVSNIPQGGRKVHPIGGLDITNTGDAEICSTRDSKISAALGVSLNELPTISADASWELSLESQLSAKYPIRAFDLAFRDGELEQAHIESTNVNLQRARFRSGVVICLAVLIETVVYTIFFWGDKVKIAGNSARSCRGRTHTGKHYQEKRNDNS